MAGPTFSGCEFRLCRPGGLAEDLDELSPVRFGIGDEDDVAVRAGQIAVRGELSGDRATAPQAAAVGGRAPLHDHERNGDLVRGDLDMTGGRGAASCANDGAEDTDGGDDRCPGLGERCQALDGRVVLVLAVVGEARCRVREARERAQHDVIGDKSLVGAALSESSDARDDQSGVRGEQRRAAGGVLPDMVVQVAGDDDVGDVEQRGEFGFPAGRPVFLAVEELVPGRADCLGAVGPVDPGYRRSGACEEFGAERSGDTVADVDDVEP